MGDKELILAFVGFVFMCVFGLISLVEYALCLLIPRTISFIGTLAGWGLILGIVFFMLGMAGMYGDK